MKSLSISLVVPCLLLMAGTSKAQIRGEGSCPDPDSMVGFEYQRYLGQWHTHSQSLRLPSQNKCKHMFYADETQDEYPTLFTYTKEVGIRTGEITETWGNIRSVTDWVPAIMESFEQGELPTQVPNYTILATDYDNFAVVFSCKQLGPKNSQLVVVLTREREPSQDVVEMASEQIALKGFDNLQMLRELQNCDDSFYADPNDF